MSDLRFDGMGREQLIHEIATRDQTIAAQDVVLSRLRRHHGGPWADRARALDYAIRYIGFPVLMVIVFIAWDAGWLPSKSRDTYAAIVTHDTERKHLDTQLADALSRLTDEIGRQYRITKLMCASLAKDPRIQERCLE